MPTPKDTTAISPIFINSPSLSMLLIPLLPIQPMWGVGATKT